MSTSTISIPVVGASMKQSGADSGFELTLPESLISTRLLAQSVRVYTTNKRQGTASAKDRSRVSGTTKKMYKQKGTGNARHGSKKAPIFVGGGVVGGPKPKTYSLSLGKQQTKLALRSAFAYRLSQKEVMVFASSTIETVTKTKDAIALIHGADVRKKITVIVTKHDSPAFALALRNIPKLHVHKVDSISPYVLLQGDKVICSPSAIETMAQAMSK